MWVVLYKNEGYLSNKSFYWTIPKSSINTCPHYSCSNWAPVFVLCFRLGSGSGDRSQTCSRRAAGSNVISDIRPEITQTDLCISDKLEQRTHWKLSFVTVTVMTSPGLKKLTRILWIRKSPWLWAEIISYNKKVEINKWMSDVLPQIPSLCKWASWAWILLSLVIQTIKGRICQLNGLYSGHIIITNGANSV